MKSRIVFLILFIVLVSIVLYQIFEQRSRQFLEAEKRAGEQFAEQYGAESTPSVGSSSSIINKSSVRRGIVGLDEATTISVVVDDTPTTPGFLPRKGSGTIGGKVQTFDRTPISSTEIWLVKFQGMTEIFIRKSYSDAKGLFSFMYLPPGTYELRVFHPEFSSSAVSNINLKDKQTRDDITVILTAGVSLAGKVITTSKEPIRDVYLTVSKKITRINPAGGSPLTLFYQCAYQTTDDNGLFMMEHVPGGDVMIKASKSGYSDVEILRTIDELAPPPLLEIVLKESAGIGGTVISPDGKGVLNAEVSVSALMTEARTLQPLTGEKVKKSVTDSEGSFLIKELLADTIYELTVGAAGFPEAHFPNIRSNTYENRLTLTYGGEIRGKVTYLHDNSAAINIRVKATKTDKDFTFSATAYTDERGDYVLYTIPPGIYTVSVDSISYTAKPWENVKVDALKKVDKVDFTIYSGMTIQGYVLDKNSGTQVAEASVVLEGQVTGGGSIKASTLSSWNGSFVFENLAEGSFSLYAEATGYYTRKSAADKEKVLLVKGKPVQPVTLYVYSGGSVTGVVNDVNGMAINNAYVRIFQPPGSKGRIDTSRLQAMTTSGGTFTITGIDVTSLVGFLVRADADGYASGVSTPVLLTPTEPTASTSITLGKGGMLSGVVREDSKDGTYLEGVKVTLQERAFRGDRFYTQSVTWTNALGQFFFQHITPGSISIIGQLDGYVDGSATITIEENKEEQVTIILKKGWSITGYVYDDLGQPLEKTSVSASPQSGAQGSGSGEADAIGRFLIKDISKGRFTLRASFSQPTPQGRQTYLRRIKDVSAGSRNTTFVFPINAEIMGRVYDETNNKPIEGFSVSGFGDVDIDNDGNTYTFRIPAKQYSQTNGEFHCYSIPTGKYTLLFSAPGYVTQRMTDISIRSPDRRDIGVISLTSAGTIKATILSELNQEPVPQIKGQLDKGLERTAVSNTEGLMMFKNLSAQVYTLTLDHDHYISKTIGNISVQSGEVTNLGIVYVEPGATLDGVVKDSDDNPMQNVLISATSDEKTHKTRSDSFGYYILDGIKQGDVEVTALIRLHGIDTEMTKRLSVLPDTTYHLDFIFDISQSIKGQLSARMFDIKNSRIYLYPIDADNSISNTRKRVITPDADLTYEIDGLLVGRYYLIVQAEVLSNGSMNITVSPTRWYDVIDLIMQEEIATVRFHEGSISGMVMDGVTGKALKDATIELIRESEVGISDPETMDKFLFRSQSSGDGSFTIAPLPSGRYDIYIESMLVDEILIDADEVITNFTLLLTP